VTYLDAILVSTRTRVAEARAKVSDDVLEQRIASQEEPRGFRAALERGVFLPPSPFEACFLSVAHTADDIAFVAERLSEALVEAVG
jgi:glutamate-1-semialdehyde aminotransferase